MRRRRRGQKRYNHDDDGDGDDYEDEIVGDYDGRTMDI